MGSETVDVGASAVRQGFQALAAAQPDAADRLALSRITTGAAVIRTVWHLPPADVLVEYADLLDRAQGRPTPRRTLSPAAYEALRATTILSVGAWALGVDHPAVKAAANASFAVLQFHVVGFHDELWSYNSHLNLYLGLLSVSGTGGRADADPVLAAAALSVLQALYASVYLQSGVSKLVGAGWRWVDGRTLRAGWGELGTPLGKRLSRADPRVAALASTGALALELGFAPLLLLAWRHRVALGAAAIAFHASVKATMDISFWHLSWFSAPLFALPRAAVERITAAGRGPGATAARAVAAVAVAATAAKPLAAALRAGFGGSRRAVR